MYAFTAEIGCTGEGATTVLSAKQFVKSHPTLYKAAKKLKPQSRAPRLENFTSMPMSFDYVNTWLQQVPNIFDCYVGVPRAGLLFANILASCYGRALATPEGFIRGEIWNCHGIQNQQIKNVLIIEDSILTGKQLRESTEIIKAYNPLLTVKTASLFVTDFKNAKVDYCLFSRSEFTWAAWNLLTSGFMLSPLAVDMDGVLCRDCPPNLDVYSKEYEDWIADAAPFLIPRYPIKAVVTGRLERFRPQTEDWLARNQVKYDELIMRESLDVGSGSHKAKAIKHLSPKPVWFWESNRLEAEVINSEAHLPVLCVDEMVLLK